MQRCYCSVHNFDTHNFSRSIVYLCFCLDFLLSQIINDDIFFANITNAVDKKTVNELATIIIIILIILHLEELLGKRLKF